MPDSAPLSLLPASPEDLFPDLSRRQQRLGLQLLAAVAAGAVAAIVWPIHETVRASGVLRPKGENTVVQAPLGGSVERVLVRQNQRVSRGQVLAVLDQEILHAQQRQLQQELGTLERQRRLSLQQQQALATQVSALQQLTRAGGASSLGLVAQARANLSFSRSEWLRYRHLLASGAVSRSLVDEKQMRHQVMAAELQRAMQGVVEQRARGLNELARLRDYHSQVAAAAEDQTRQVADRRTRLQEIERNLNLSLIRTPVAGTVVTTPLRRGHPVLRAGDVVASIAPRGAALEIKVQVSDRQVSQLRQGQHAVVQVLGCPRAEYGTLKATLLGISADTLRPGLYEVSLRPNATRLGRAQRSCALLAGMEVKADVLTRRTTVGQFLLNRLQLGA